MTILIGLTPDEHGMAALDLGAALARSLDQDVVVAVVAPTPWPPNPYRPDTEYLALQESAARQALNDAQARLGEVAGEFVVHQARSVSSGLIELAERTGATWLVLGSAEGALGQVSLGGIAERVMHSSVLPVVLAPRGYPGDPSGRVTRITVGFGRADRDSDLLTTAAGVADTIGADLRVACFAVRPLLQVGFVDDHAEELVVGAWTAHLEADISQAVASAGGTVAVKVETVVGQGAAWPEALANVDWSPGDVLVIGASSSPWSHFFLGSHAAKIVRNATVPVILAPRSLIDPGQITGPRPPGTGRGRPGAG